MNDGNRLPALLRQLHAELERSTSLDAESRELLAVLARDLQRFEAHRASAGEFAVRFEAEHPEVAATLRAIADLFAKAGI